MGLSLLPCASLASGYLVLIPGHLRVNFCPWAYSSVTYTNDGADALWRYSITLLVKLLLYVILRDEPKQMKLGQLL